MTLVNGILCFRFDCNGQMQEMFVGIRMERKCVECGCTLPSRETMFRMSMIFVKDILSWCVVVIDLCY